ncbi:MAG: hypothetical protein QW543_04845 [Sulfolobales archaeon]
MSRKGKKQVGKQITKRKYRRVRYDLIVLGVVLIISGVLMYNIIIAVQPSSGPNIKEPNIKEENLVEILKRFVSESQVKNESIVLVFRVRGNIPYSAFTLGTLDYIYVHIGKEVITLNESTKTTFTSFVYTNQAPLHIIAEVLGLAFKSERIDDIFFNSQIIATWHNLTVENLGERIIDLKVLGEMKTVSQVYRYYKAIDGKTRYVEVTAWRLIEFGYIPARVDAAIDDKRFSLELINVRKVS